MLGEFYKDFEPTLKAASENMGRRPAEARPDRLLSVELCGEELVTRPR